MKSCLIKIGFRVRIPITISILSPNYTWWLIILKQSQVMILIKLTGIKHNKIQVNSFWLWETLLQQMEWNELHLNEMSNKCETKRTQAVSRRTKVEVPAQHIKPCDDSYLILRPWCWTALYDLAPAVMSPACWQAPNELAGSCKCLGLCVISHTNSDIPILASFNCFRIKSKAAYCKDKVG